MMTQIQPHFLFNALNTIRALYAKDPPLADRTLEDFSSYLRQNLESLRQTDLVPITKELEHTRLYAEIEVLRFPNVRVEYRIEDESFQIPALTIQPLVENAIRHGVRIRKDGLVIVSTFREADAHRITIEDNGIGFDPKQIRSSEETHIGLENVKSRVEQMCGGTMTLSSTVGEGTIVRIYIPAASGAEKEDRRK
jgi:sensor histidine kinase YesM